MSSPLFSKDVLERLTNVLEVIAYVATFIGALAGVAYVSLNRPLRRIIQSETLREQQSMQRQISSAQTEQERLKNENAHLQLRIAEIHRRMANRFLTDSERATLVEALRPHRGHQIIIVVKFGDSEAEQYGEGIISAFQEAGWAVQHGSSTWGLLPHPPHGVMCRISAHPGAAVRTVVETFQRLGMNARSEEVNAKEDFIELVIGPKALA